MITKGAIDIVNKLIRISGEDIDQDQQDVYIYGLECFLNTFITIILLMLWGLLSHRVSRLICGTRLYNDLGNCVFFIETFHGRSTCSNSTYMHIR